MKAISSHDKILAGKAVAEWYRERGKFVEAFDRLEPAIDETAFWAHMKDGRRLLVSRSSGKARAREEATG